MNLITALKNDENGFVVSAELVLVGTICVLGMIVGLTELSYGVNEELEDLGCGGRSLGLHLQKVHVKETRRGGRKEGGEGRARAVDPGGGGRGQSQTQGQGREGCCEAGEG